MLVPLRLAVRTAPPLDAVRGRASHVPRVAAMFGLGIDRAREQVIVPPTTLTLRPHQVVFITGPSGGGKSTLLRLLRDQLQAGPEQQHDGGPVQPPPHLIDFDTLTPPPDRPVVDGFSRLPLDATLRTLALAGLGDAFVFLRVPHELSDGQRYRLRLAHAYAQSQSASQAHGCGAAVGSSTSHRFTILLADEFAATLDRRTAAAIARNARRWVTRHPVCLIAATTHDDLLDPLAPDVLIEKGLGEAIEVTTKDSAEAQRHGGHRASP